MYPKDNNYYLITKFHFSSCQPKDFLLISSFVISLVIHDFQLECIQSYLYWCLFSSLYHTFKLHPPHHFLGISQSKVQYEKYLTIFFMFRVERELVVSALIIHHHIARNPNNHLLIAPPPSIKITRTCWCCNLRTLHIDYNSCFALSWNLIVLEDRRCNIQDEREGRRRFCMQSRRYA